MPSSRLAVRAMSGRLDELVGLAAGVGGIEAGSSRVGAEFGLGRSVSMS